MTLFLLFLLISAFAYRVTRFVTSDSWPPCEWFRGFLAHHAARGEQNFSGWFWRNTFELFSCHWCFGSWVAIATTLSVHYLVTPLPPNVGLWVGAVACVVGLIGENLDG